MTAATATLSRGSTTITMDLVDESGSPLIATDIGKPEAGASNKGTLDPRWSDQWSRAETISFSAELASSSAYQDAIDLADLIKSHSDGQDLSLDVSLGEYPDSMTVCPAAEQDEALTISYDVGQRDWLRVELVLTRIQTTNGSADQQASTPTATGSGPITLTDGSTSVEFTRDVVVDRAVGRPRSSVRPQPQDLPKYYDERKRAHDQFELAAEFGVGNAASKASDLRKLVGQRLGRDSLTLDFKGVYGLGEFDVVPAGANALRFVRQAGEQGTVTVPTLSLRRVFV